VLISFTASLQLVFTTNFLLVRKKGGRNLIGAGQTMMDGFYELWHNWIYCVGFFRQKKVEEGAIFCFLKRCRLLFPFF
jgi:hypothetical protein